MTVTPINPGGRIGHVHLKVADMDRALAFYCGVLGFQLTQRRGSQVAFISAGGYHHHIGLNTWESRGGPPPAPGTTGLYHLAVLYSTRAVLADALRRLIAAAIELEGPPIMASAKRSICAIRTTTASSFIGIGRASNGRATRREGLRCSPSRSIWSRCSQSAKKRRSGKRRNWRAS